LRALIAHELAHVRRHDYLVNLLQTAVELCSSSIRLFGTSQAAFGRSAKIAAMTWWSEAA